MALLPFQRLSPKLKAQHIDTIASDAGTLYEPGDVVEHMLRQPLQIELSDTDDDDSPTETDRIHSDTAVLKSRVAALEESVLQDNGIYED